MKGNNGQNLTGINKFEEDLTRRVEIVKRANEALRGKHKANSREAKHLTECGEEVRNKWPDDVNKFVNTLKSLHEATGFSYEKLEHKMIKAYNESNFRVGDPIADSETARLIEALLPPASKTNNLGNLIENLLNRGKEIPKAIKGKNFQNHFQNLSGQDQYQTSDEDLLRELDNLSDSMPYEEEKTDEEHFRELEEELAKESSKKGQNSNLKKPIHKKLSANQASRANPK